MPTLRTTVGQLLVNEALPEEMRDYARTLGKKSLNDLLINLAKLHPDKYREVTHKLSQAGWQAAQRTGGDSFGLEDMRVLRSAKIKRIQLRQKIETILDSDTSPEQKDLQILKAVSAVAEKQQDDVLNESLAEKNPLASAIQSGSRGNKMNLASLLASDLLYVDHRDRAIPFPVMKSYSSGLSPAEYWAGAYGARKGTQDVKFGTRDAGYLSKQLAQSSHRLLVTAQDAEKEPVTTRGYPVDTSDADNEGSLLSQEVGGYPRNTVLTPKILDSLRSRGIARILVRSPIVGGPADGGVYSRDVGVREFGREPGVGENPGLAAAQAMSEPLAQGALSSKHSGGVAGARASKAVSGFEFVNQLIQTPKHFKGGAAHVDVDGRVSTIEEAPTGGHFVFVGGQKHYVAEGYELKVKVGDEVEAGDVLSEGEPNPSIIVKHKGVGEGRRYFIKALRGAFEDANMGTHRRNIELVARGLLNHVRLTEETDDGVPDDVLQYHLVESKYRPRPDFLTKRPRDAKGKYLERPYLHYSIGTKVRPSVLKDLEEFGVQQIDVHNEPPPFEPVMIRGAANLQHDPDWITKMFGSGLKSGLLKATHRGATSTTTGTSFVPGLAQAETFGQVGKVITPQTESRKLEPKPFTGSVLG